MSSGADLLQDTVQRREDYLRLAIDTIPALAWCNRPDGSTEFLNKRWLDYTGLRNEEALGWGWKVAVHPDDLPRVLEVWHSLLARGIAGGLEARLRRYDGAYRWFLFRAEPLVDARGEVVKWYGTNTDIEDRKCAEDALRRSEAYLAEAQRLSRTGSFGWSVPANELVWSDETFRILGYERTTKPSLQLVEQRVHQEDRAFVRQALERAAREGTDYDLEHRLRLPDGEIKHVRVMARRWRTGGDPGEFVGAVMDITERKLSQEAMRAARARFEGILEIAEDAIISVDAAQTIILFNRGAERIFGYGEAEVLGRPLDVLLPQRFACAHREQIAGFARAAEVARSMAQRREVFGRRKDGTEFPAEASISKLALGEEVVFTVILRDSTQRKLAAETLRASEHLARGQLQALARTLDALAQERDPDRLLEHVLQTIVEQTSAHSVSVWERSADGGWLELVAVIEGGSYQTRENALHPASRIPILAQDHPVWKEVLRTGRHVVLEDLDRECARSRVGSDPEAPWHRIMDDADVDPAMALLKRYLRGLGVVAILFVPTMVAGEVAGILDVRFQEKRAFRREEIELTRALAHQAMLAIQLMRLSRRSREAAVEAERNRLARDIHDTLAQGFTGVIVQLEASADAASRGLAGAAEEHRRRAADLARESLQEARRSVRALRPQALEAQSLPAALDGLLRKMTAGGLLQVQLELEGRPRSLPETWDENLLRIGQEVLTNALRHAGASEFRAHLAFGPEAVRLGLRDNGRGFDPAGRHDGFGLIGIRERVESMGGRLSIRSTVGLGTTIEIILPFQGADQGGES